MTHYDHLSMPLVKVSSPHPHVLLVELAREPVNAFNVEYWTQYGKVFDKISQEHDVRAVVLASSLPRIFSAGIDISDLGKNNGYSDEPARRALQIREHVSHFQEAISSTERCPYPVIAAVHGVAFGLAIDMITACDIRLVSQDAKLSIKEVDVGLASDIGTLARLPKLSGNASLIHEFAFTARSFSASDAEKMGLVSRVVPGSRKEVVDAALEIAREIASKSPIATLGTKRVLQHARDHTVRESLDYVALWNAAMLQTSDLQTAATAWRTKQTPSFTPLGKVPTKL